MAQRQENFIKKILKLVEEGPSNQETVNKLLEECKIPPLEH